MLPLVHYCFILMLYAHVCTSAWSNITCHEVDTFTERKKKLVQ